MLSLGQPTGASADSSDRGENSTQAAFGQVMYELGKADPDDGTVESQLAARILTTAPDVATSTNLSGFLNQRRIFCRVRRLTFVQTVACTRARSCIFLCVCAYTYKCLRFMTPYQDEVADPAKAHGVMSVNAWRRSPMGQHIELGIAEANLFLMLSAAGMAHKLFGQRVGTVVTTVMTGDSRDVIVVSK